LFTEKLKFMIMVLLSKAMTDGQTLGPGYTLAYTPDIRAPYNICQFA